MSVRDSEICMVSRLLMLGRLLGGVYMLGDPQHQILILIIESIKKFLHGLQTVFHDAVTTVYL